MVYLDLSHKDPKELDVKLGGIIEIYEKFVGEDPRKVPMKIFPAVHYSMGGLWVDYDQMTNIPGIFAAGECDYSQHGANRLRSQLLLICYLWWIWLLVRKQLNILKVWKSMQMIYLQAYLIVTT